MAADDAGTDGHGTRLDVGLRRALAAGPEARAVVLVEGMSDQVALETLAERRGQDLGSKASRSCPWEARRP